MPTKNDAYEQSQTILNTEDWMIVEPMTGLAFEYFAPEKLKPEWNNKFRDGDVYFVIDKDKEPILTYTIFKNDTDHKIEYIGSEVMRNRVMTRNELFHELPNDVKSELEPIIGYSPIYDLLVKIKNGEQVSSNEMERADNLIYKFNYNEKNPGKSTIKLHFDDIEDISWKSIGSSGLDSCIYAYDCLLSSMNTPGSIKLDLNNITYSWDSFMTLVAIHPGDNDTTAAIGGTWYGALLGYHGVDRNRMIQLEFYKELKEVSDKIN